MPNRFLEQAQQGRNEFWRYALITVGIVLVAIVSQFIFLLPAIFFEGTTDLNQYSPVALLLITMAPFPFAMVFLLAGYRFLLKRPVSNLFTASGRFGWRKLLFSGGIWFGLSALSDVFFALLNPSNYTWSFVARQYIPYALLSLLLIPIQTTTEELIFRGFLMQWVGRYSKRIWLPLILPALVFMALHGANPEVFTYGAALTLPFYLGIGLVLGWVTLKSEGLELAIGLHLANNLYASLAVTFPSSALASPALFTVKVYDSLGALVVFFVMAALYLAILIGFRRKWIFPAVATLAALLALGGFARPAAAATVSSVDRYEAQVTIEPGGTLLVDQTVTYSFPQGAYDSVTRGINLTRVDGVEVLGASLDGQVLTEGSGPGQFEVQQSASDLQVTWHFTPLGGSSHAFGLNFRVTGAFQRQGAQDLLDWAVIPDVHDDLISAGEIDLLLPEGMSFSGTPALTGIESSPSMENGQARFTFSNLPVDQGVHLQAQFPAGSIISAPPAWQQAELARGQAVHGALPAAAGVGVALFLVLGIVFWRNSRKARGMEPGEVATAAIETPPDDLSPLMAGYLLAGNHFYCEHGLAVTVELAARGCLSLEERASRGLLGGKEFVIRPGNRPSGEDPVEAIFYDMIFKPGPKQTREVRIQEVVGRINANSGSISHMIQETLADKGILDSQLIRQGNRVTTASFGSIFLGGILAVGGAILAGNGSPGMVQVGILLAGAGLGLALGGAAGLLLLNSWDTFTPIGIERQVRWQGFQAYLKGLTRGGSLQQEWLEKYLAYTVAFGLVDRWMQRFKEQGLDTSLPWAVTVDGAPVDGPIVAAVMAASAASTGAGKYINNSGIAGWFKKSN